MSTLSIIVSLYNSEKTIKMCIDSILSQTTKYKLEIIAVATEDNSHPHWQ